MALLLILHYLLFLALLQLCLAAPSCWRNTACSGPQDAAFPGPWESNIYAPFTRTVKPKSILSLVSGKLISSYPGSAKLERNGSALVFDFGIEVGGIATLSYTSTGTGRLGLAFSEASTWMGEWSDASNGRFTGKDGAIYADITKTSAGTYTMPDKSMRGGFRYMTLFLTTTTSTTAVEITDIDLEISFQPTWSNLRAYQGYFHSNDELLNRIWYAGAYTLQTNSVPPNTGRQVPMLSNGWANNGTLGPGDTIIVDGAKRDRAVWPGDMGIAVPSAFVSTGDLESVRNALQVMYNYQNSDGSFPEAGPPLLQQNSDTYHMWTMIGTYNYMLYTSDIPFVQKNWSKYLKAMTFITSKINNRGLLIQTGTRDWARWATGGNNTQANMILYRTLTTGAELASWMNDANGLNTTWLKKAEELKGNIVRYCYDEGYGAFRDNATSTTLHPQDANSMALLFNVIDPSSPTASSISTRLTQNWSPIGAVAPELPENISPFISSFEIQAHFSIGRPDRALDLIRRSWGWYANHPNGTGSTVIEGYLVNGTFGYRSNRGYGYDASYVSHAHGWSSGPTSALTEFVLGLRVMGLQGRRWSFAPMFGDLKTVEGGFVTGLGKFSAMWQVGDKGYKVEVSTPEGTEGRVLLPLLKDGVVPTIVVNGRAVEDGDVMLENVRARMDVEGGEYVIEVSE